MSGVPVTMHDVAVRAGVSIKTVSNVVNGYPHIRPETRERVEEAIEHLGYRLNTTARNLRTRRTDMITLAVPELSLPYFAELADSVIRAAEQHGLTVLIEQTSASKEREMEVLSGKRRHLTDGLLFSPLELGQDDIELFSVDFPLVVLGERVFDAPADHVTMNNVAAAKAATLHLASLGRRRIALIGAHEGEQVGSAALRTAGYLQGLEEAGLPYDPALMGEAGLWHRATGAETMARMLDAGVEVDAVFALNDAMALGALHALHARRIDVPDDVALIGFDDIDDVKYSAPTISSVDPGREQIARTAVDLLVERIASTGHRTFRRVVPDSRIVGRESTGDVPIGAPEKVVAVQPGGIEEVAVHTAAS
ncbi:LacI family transcriptional regulator [Isoptericola variabilis J7]|uniref:Transcriptional regulator, LacI family n=1 Tax=Isoptericola variabilis (strain 225) TaxID=743718 RepID=F6FX79_ISOV2|nr:LacI family DNA-binding transcriptional regulator [Isoptericola variabilis]AEG43582.1 transcriptional regulator, LacI family [Isoptericola variabilis 225]TWH32050.1 LacI family transcriptional regulator [Isoptericola variabilis J7]